MDLPNISRDFPQSILIDILLRLPLKSVITCKLVCKSWYHIISDSSFAEDYNSAEPFQCSLYFDSKHLYVNESDETGREVFETSFNLNLHLRTENNQILRMVGSCNGLCCFLLETGFSVDKFEETVYIYNPLTCEYIEIRERMESDYVCRRMAIGFGCSKYTNQYKVVRFLPEIDLQLLGLRIQGRVYTIGVDNRWREFKDPCIPYTISDKYSVLFNGALHWVGFETSPESNVIYAFDVEEEKGERIQLPLALQSLKKHPFIGVLNDQLCALAEGDYFRVWVLEDYGIVESWTKYILLKDPIPRYSFLWHPGFVCNFASTLFGTNQEEVGSPVLARKGKKECMIVGQKDRFQALPYIPCFSSLNHIFGGGNLALRNV